MAGGGTSAIGTATAGDLETVDKTAALAEATAVQTEVKVPTGDALGTPEHEAGRMLALLRGADPNKVFGTSSEHIGADPSKVSPAELAAGKTVKREPYVSGVGKTIREGMIPGQPRMPEPGEEPPPEAPARAPSPTAAKPAAPAAPVFDDATLKNALGIADPTPAKPEDELARIRDENERAKRLWRDGVRELQTRPVDSLLDDLKVDPQAIVAGLRARGLLHEAAPAPAAPAVSDDLKLPEDADDITKALLAENRALKGQIGTISRRFENLESKITSRETAEQTARREADVSRRYGSLAQTLVSKLNAVPALQGEKQRVERIVENVMLRTQRDAGFDASAEEITKIGLQHAFDEVRMTLASPKAIVAAEAARGVAAPVPTSAGETVRPISGGARTRSVDFSNDDARRLHGLAALREMSGE